MIQIEIFKNPVSNELPNIYYVYCEISGQIAIGTGITDNARETTVISETIERELLHQLKSDKRGINKDEKHLVPSQRFQNYLSPIEWIEVVSLSGEKYWMHRPTRGLDNFNLYRHSSTGIAVHKTKKRARFKAILELFERYCIKMWWEYEHNIKRTEPNTVQQTSYYKILKKKGWDFHFYLLNNNKPFVLLCCAINRHDKIMPKSGVITGYGCDINFDTACIASFCETIQLIESIYLCGSIDSLSDTQQYFTGKEGALSIKNKIISSSESKLFTSFYDFDFYDIYFRDIQHCEYYYCEAFLTKIDYLPNEGNDVIWPI